MHRPNFAQCAAYFIGNNSLDESTFKQYVYNGTVWGIERNTTSQITYDGCIHLCGTGAAYYKWPVVAGTITTWTLPVVGVILQAPFESNEFWATMFTLARWIGSPIASLSYTLWNMKVSGKCALLMDMAVRSDTERSMLEPGTSDFSQMRDSLYILAAMNQFSVNPEMNSAKREAETLLRIALFSRGLHSPGTNDRFLPRRRQFVADRLRIFRKRGIVPVYISTMWFLFALCLSIQGAFDLLGENATAHNLALGFLLGWLPTLFLSFIVDRNFTSIHDVRDHLNGLVSDVREALTDEGAREKYIQTYQGRYLGTVMRNRIDRILTMPATKDFFVKFAGQGRLRWHYGVAHPILTDIERNFIRDKGRAWLSFNEQEARSNLVLGDTDERGLIWFDLREMWQVLSSVVIVLGTISGAFILSFFEPTMGLGCRSGGYMIFAILSLLLLVLEIGFWYLISATENDPRLTHTYRIDTVLGIIEKVVNAMDSALVQIRATITSKNNDKWKVAEHNHNLRRTKRRHRTLRDWANICIFLPLEMLSFTWLLYIVMAQTIGAYQTCSCQTSHWGGVNYMDFNQYDFSAIPLLRTTWTAATVVSCSVIGLSMMYIVVEWCLQSHLSTEKYEAALRGLRRTRNFRRFTYPYRWLVNKAISMVTTRRSVVWTYNVTYQPEEGMLRRQRRFDSIPLIRVDRAMLKRQGTFDSVAVIEEEVEEVDSMRLHTRSTSPSSASSRSGATSVGQQPFGRRLSGIVDVRAAAI